MQRRLTWAGHVYRMDFNRLPRKLLSSCVDHPTPRGRPQAHYGHGFARNFKKVGLSTSTWHELAANRPAWLELLQKSVSPSRRKIPRLRPRIHLTCPLPYDCPYRRLHRFRLHRLRRLLPQPPPPPSPSESQPHSWHSPHPPLLTRPPTPLQ